MIGLIDLQEQAQEEEEKSSKKRAETERNYEYYDEDAE